MKSAGEVSDLTVSDLTIQSLTFLAQLKAQPPARPSFRAMSSPLLTIEVLWGSRLEG